MELSEFIWIQRHIMDEIDSSVQSIRLSHIPRSGFRNDFSPQRCGDKSCL